MRNIKALLFTILFFLFTAYLFAHKINYNDPEAKKMLDKVFLSVKKLKHFQANFSLNVEDANGKSMGVKTGVFYSKATNYKVVINPNQEIYSDGKTIWNYDKSTNEIQITTLDPTQATLTPDKLFSNFYDKDFSYRWVGKTNIRGKKVEEIEMTPTDTKKPFFKIVLYLDMLHKMPLSAKIFDKSGLRYMYVITKFDKAKQMGNIAFDKSRFPNAQIVDLR